MSVLRFLNRIINILIYFLRNIIYDKLRFNLFSLVKY